MSSVLCCDEKCVYKDAKSDPNTPGSYPILGAKKKEEDAALCNKVTNECIF